MKKNKKINYKGILLTTILFTVSVLVVVSLINFSLLYFVFPGEFANFCYSLGFENVSANLYYKDYKKTDDINACYKALNLKIKCGDDKMVVEIYEEFSNHDDYKEFIDKLNEINEMLDSNILEQSIVLNEGDFLQKEYIKSLMQIDNEKSFDKALECFYFEDEYDLKNNGVYALDVFVNKDESKIFFNQVFQGDNTLIQDMQRYFDNLATIFDNNKDVQENVQKAYLLALGNKIITVGSNVNTIYNELNLNSDLESINNNKMLEINNIIKQLLQKD